MIEREREKISRDLQMSTISSGKRVTTPKRRSNRLRSMTIDVVYLEQRSRSQQSQKKGSVYQEDVCVRTSLPPLVEGAVHAILICHLPKLRWNNKHQSLCRSVNIKVAWWGEDETSSTFKSVDFHLYIHFFDCNCRPQISGTLPDLRQQPSTTAKYYIRSELKQFGKYLTGERSERMTEENENCAH